MPDLVTRVALNPVPALHLDVGGVVRVFRHTVFPYDQSFREVGGGVSVNARVNPTGSTRLIGQVAFGSGLGRYLGGLAPDVAFRSDGSVTSIPASSWVGGIEQMLSSRTSVGGYYSGVRADGTYFADLNGRNIGFGFPGSSNAANRMIEQVTGSAITCRNTTRGAPPPVSRTHAPPRRD
jgi:hypothetical protein